MQCRYYWLLFFFVLSLSSCKYLAKASSPNQQDPQIQAYFNNRKTGNKSYTDPYRKIKREGDNLEELIIKSIKQAESQIEIAIQELQLPNIALELAKKARAGVKVRVILENNYSQAISDYSQTEINNLSARERDRYNRYFRFIDFDHSDNLSNQEIATRDALKILQQANIPILDDRADGSKGSGLMHHKFIIIDRQTLITGSTNLTLSGVHGDEHNPNTRGNANHLLQINSPELAELFAQEFELMWGDGVGGKLDSRFGLAKPYRSPQEVIVGKSRVTVQFSPTSRKADWTTSTNGLIGEFISQANNSIDLALFVFSDQNIADLLQKRYRQGIRIRGLIDAEFIFRYYSEALDMLGVAIARKCQYEPNNNLWTSPIKTIGTANLAKGDKLHHKLAIIDEQIVITGSQNWSAAANHQNEEAVLIIDNQTVAKQFKQEFTRLYQDANLGLSNQVKLKIKRQEQKCN